MSRTFSISCALAVGFLATTLFGATPLAKDSNKGKDGKDEFVGAVWTYTLTKGNEKATGQFRVSNDRIFKGPKEVGKVEPNGDKTTITITGWDEMNGTAELTKNRRNPPGASGTLKKKDGSEWQMKVTWKDG